MAWCLSNARLLDFLLQPCNGSRTMKSSNREMSISWLEPALLVSCLHQGAFSLTLSSRSINAEEVETDLSVNQYVPNMHLVQYIHVYCIMSRLTNWILDISVIPKFQAIPLLEIFNWHLLNWGHACMQLVKQRQAIHKSTWTVKSEKCNMRYIWRKKSCTWFLLAFSLNSNKIFRIKLEKCLLVEDR